MGYLCVKVVISFTWKKLTVKGTIIYMFAFIGYLHMESKQFDIESKQIDFINNNGAAVVHRNFTKLYLVQLSLGVFFL